MAEHAQSTWQLLVIFAAVLSLSLFLFSDAKDVEGLTIRTDSQSYSEDRAPNASVNPDSEIVLLVPITASDPYRLSFESSDDGLSNVPENIGTAEMDNEGLYLITARYIKADNDFLTDGTTFKFTTDSGSSVSDENDLPLLLSAIEAQDTNGNDIGHDIRPSEQIMLTFNFDNNGNSAPSYVALIQVSAQDGSTDYLTWHTGTASVGEVSRVGFAWQPEEVGTYIVKAFLWTSLDSPMALSEPSETELTVGNGNDDTQFITTTTVTLDIGETSPTGTFKLTGVSPDSITGLQYYDYPVGGGPGTPVDMTLGQQVTNGCTVTVKLLSINHVSQQATFEQTVDSDPNRMCPICWWQLEIMDTTTATSNLS